MKRAIAATLLSLSLTAFAQTNSLDQISQEVGQMVAAHAEKLAETDKLTIRKNLRQILQIFKINGHELPTGSFICDANNNQLINVDARKLIHDFSSADDCQQALANVKVGKNFCDLTDNTLRLIDGRLAYDFSDAVNCKDAVESIFKVKKFCDYNDNTLRKFDGSLLYDFSSKEECLKALN